MRVTKHAHNGVDKNSNGPCFEKPLSFDDSHIKTNGMTQEGSSLVAHMIRESGIPMP